jgi:hypothetical protein
MPKQCWTGVVVSAPVTLALLLVCHSGKAATGASLTRVVPMRKVDITYVSST